MQCHVSSSCHWNATFSTALQWLCLRRFFEVWSVWMCIMHFFFLFVTERNCSVHDSFLKDFLGWGRKLHFFKSLPSIAFHSTSSNSFFITTTKGNFVNEFFTQFLPLGRFLTWEMYPLYLEELEKDCSLSYQGKHIYSPVWKHQFDTSHGLCQDGPHCVANAYHP